MKILVISALLMVLLAGCASPDQGTIQASGQIEAKQVDVASELSGRVVEVSVHEGDSVKAGEILLRLDDSLLQEQRKAAAASLDTTAAASQSAQSALYVAQAQYTHVLDAALAEDEQTRLADWFPNDPKQFDQPRWYFTRAEQVQVAQGQVDAAQKALGAAQAKLEDLTKSLPESKFVAVEQRLESARQAYLITKQVNEVAHNSVKKDTPEGLFNLTHCGTNQGYKLATGQLTNQVYSCTGDQNLSAASQRQYDDAQAELAAAQSAYNQLLGSAEAQQLLNARANVSVLQQRYYTAMDRLRGLQTGELSPSVTAAQGSVDQAQAAYDQSQKAIAQAQADLGLIDTQLKKLAVEAPIEGVVLVRSVEAGEVIQAGAPVMTIGQLNILRLTVYISENEYGQIHLGQTAKLSVDSFPGQAFTGTVTHISDQAEFTPQNVQTKEGRQTTVYAVELSVDNAGDKLKPGMPVDATFGDQVSK